MECGMYSLMYTEAVEAQVDVAGVVGTGTKDGHLTETDTMYQFLPIHRTRYQ